MTTDIVQTIFSPTVLGVIRALVAAAVPDDWDWLPNTIIGIVGIADDIDRLDDVDGASKMTHVIAIISDALDDADEIPGWSSLPEESRDGFIRGIASTTVFAIRATQAGGLPEKIYQEEFADALKGITLAVFALVESLDASRPKSTPSSLVALVADPSIARAGLE